jgi:hypothetical protein
MNKKMLLGAGLGLLGATYIAYRISRGEGNGAENSGFN